MTCGHIHPGDRLPPRGADQVEDRVLQVDRDGLLVDWSERLGTVRHPSSETGARFVRVPRRAGRRGRSSEWYSPAPLFVIDHEGGCTKSAEVVVRQTRARG